MYARFLAPRTRALRPPLRVAIAIAALLATPASGDGGPDLVDAGGTLLCARVLGAGSPTVVFESGGGGAALDDWGRLPALVAETTRVLVYDRAGVGGSGPPIAPRDGERVALELHELLGALGLGPPYVLVGHSLGGAYIRLFAGRSPGEVAGLVFLDPTTEEMRPKLDTEEDRRRFAASAAALGPGARGELEELPATLDGLARLPDPPDVPAVVISATALPAIPPEQKEAMAAAGLTEERLRAARERARAQHARLAARFPRGRHVAAEGSGHAVHLEQPGLVLEEIRRIVAAARAKPSSAPSVY